MGKINFRDASVPGDGFERWHVEFYDESSLFPVGAAYVVSLAGGAQLNFVHVADQWRRRGIGGALVRACRERWPALTYTGPMDERGASLLRRHTDYFEKLADASAGEDEEG